MRSNPCFAARRAWRQAGRGVHDRRARQGQGGQCLRAAGDDCRTDRGSRQATDRLRGGRRAGARDGRHRGAGTRGCRPHLPVRWRVTEAPGSNGPARSRISGDAGRDRGAWNRTAARHRSASRAPAVARGSSQCHRSGGRYQARARSAARPGVDAGARPGVH